MSSSMFSCCRSSKGTTDAIQDTTRRAAQAHNESVYLTAQQDATLSEEDLQALREFEEAANLLLTSNHSSLTSTAGGNGAERRETVFVDAHETERDDWSYLMMYMPATVACTS